MLKDGFRCVPNILFSLDAKSCNRSITATDKRGRPGSRPMKDVADFTSKLSELKAKQVMLAKALEIRRELIRSRRELKSCMYVVRGAFADQLNDNLKATVVDYFVTIQFQQGTPSSELVQIIQREMTWRTSQVPPATLIATAASPFQLLDAFARKDTVPLTGVVDADRNQVFGVGEANSIIHTLAKESVRHLMERCKLEDRPKIIVTKDVEGPGGKKLYQRRQFSKLSLGQQQSVLLSILLFSKSNELLVIDQPEDNLDSEYIYRTFVRSLRRVKDTRQVIVVTHNANLAVLGDAELIIPLRASSEVSTIRDRGSIDNFASKDMACTILEGCRDAFKTRQRMYGH